MYDVAINMVWFNRVETSSDYIIFKNIIYGFIQLKRKQVSLRLTIYLRKKYEKDISSL